MTTDQLTPPPPTPSDAELVARIRVALDEVAATSSAGSAVGGGGRIGSRPRMWGRIAAAAAVIAVGVVAVAVLRPDRRDPLQPTTDSTDATGATDPGPSSSDGPLPYFLAIGEEFPPGEITVADTCCAGTGTMMTAWARGGDPAAGLLVAWTAPLYSDYLPDLPGEVTTVTTADSSISTVSLGLSASEREDLTAQITPGSGLTWILPAEGWEWLGFTMAADQPALEQSFGAVTLSSRVSLEAFIELTTATAAEAVTVAGEPGWSFRLPDGSTEVVWRDPRSGLWSSLSVPADLAARVDELTAAVEMNTAGEESADATTSTVQAEPLGRLVIDAIGLDWVVGGSPALDAKEGPAWGWADGVMFIVGNRTTYGAPFLRLDELQPEDVITLETTDGPRTFEVTLVESCPAQLNGVNLDACPSRPGDDLLLVTFDPKYTSVARLTVHANEIPAG